MAVTFQYNKTSLQHLGKQLKVRERALPTLKNKEAALRMEVKRAKKQQDEWDDKLKQAKNKYESMVALWSEFSSHLVSINKVDLDVKKIAGVKTPILREIHFETKDISLFNAPTWFPDGMNILKEMSELFIEKAISAERMRLLEYARKKTTQKVNLFEKVQIPEYQDAIRKIKRFLEDEENLSKSAQKIVKTRQQQAEAEV